MIKTCCRCRNDKAVAEFGRDKGKSDGLNARCKSCNREVAAAWSKANAEKKRVTGKLYRDQNIDKKRADNRKYAKDNAERAREKTRLWVLANPERHQANRQRWYDNNQDRVQELRQKWKEAHEEEVKAYMNAYAKTRYRDDLNYRTKAIVSSRLRNCMHKEKDTTVMYLGCSIEQFRAWIESQFSSLMSWENMGQFWTFDHVRPCASYDFWDEMQRHMCFNWSNVRPCEAIENIKKGDKIDNDLIAKHEITATKWRNCKMVYQS